jgi:hypothetical protein
MGDYSEDTNHAFSSIFFIVLFSVFVMAFSANSGSHYSPSERFFPQNELLSGSISCHFNAVLSSIVSLPDIQKYFECTLHNTSLNPFSIKDKLLEYNRRVAQNFILIQKTSLSSGPVLPLGLYLHLPLNRDDDLPVLS